MNITGIKSAKYGSSFHKSPLFFCQRQADNSVNTPMLPSLTPGCTDFLHPGVPTFYTRVLRMATWGCPATKVPC
jgi:hypothetical protein